jgi:hypothetical protein
LVDFAGALKACMAGLTITIIGGLIAELKAVGRSGFSIW